MKVTEDFLLKLIYGENANGEPNLPGNASPRSAPKSPGGNPGYAAGGPDSQSLFVRLYEEECYSNVQKYFEKNLCTSAGVMSENQFLIFMRSLTDFRDHEIIEIFDIFDYDYVGGIAFDEYFLIVSMMTARLSASCTQFLYLHGKQIFEMVLEPGAQKLTYERFIRFGFVMGFSERHILNSLKDLDFDVFGFISLDEFMMYYFVVLDDFDAGRSGDEVGDKRAANPQARQGKKTSKNQQKDESCSIM
uniref:Uncharacterized protein n=1 Tax=Paramoeba aestuarina TaxID=180227 RepID=A0A6U2WYB6_9EUKA|mmetsp:Transcript_17150/g.26771  ORF Transcript_17150/g.26771 Transcript_17150/m.26771 type:complete len:247 (+) Transcript_17150:213-953(+)|eukprot:CAMPEP_0201517234 /NCGR_PEP_ID=MMETSP0161_2-20130828/8392_1 /ASSEMBLY_ACC=CAM_ASM_000251 /TAXON_ID=180227 /ORGANISM="Neoparamoeba aestuarina, Strain SoJaBio B1-5/56/2" /LENGTH=246 /DNA_ID=CAMNT_0047914671 /DNA_START=104 /DNA_END=844 /DNA_ORIENTATION=-